MSSVKVSALVGQIKITECKEFRKKLTRTEKTACKKFVAVVWGFLGHHKVENYRELVGTLVKDYSKMGSKMSLKVHVFDVRLDKFEKNMGTYKTSASTMIY